MSLFANEFTMPATTQALIDAALLRMRPGVVLRAAEQDLRVARAFLGELGERARSFVYEIPGSAFATVRRRMARHLLDLASAPGPEQDCGPGAGRELVVRGSQQELADAVGTVREVVVRVLRDLRREGAVRTERDRIVIVDPALLVLMWNESS